MDMSAESTPLYVRLSSDRAQRLHDAASASGQSKRRLVEDAVGAYLDDGGLTVGRIALAEQEPEVLEGAEAAALLRLAEDDLIKAAQAGELPGRQIGKQWRFSRSALLSWLRGERQA